MDNDQEFNNFVFNNTKKELEKGLAIFMIS